MILKEKDDKTPSSRRTSARALNLNMMALGARACLHRRHNRTLLLGHLQPGHAADHEVAFFFPGKAWPAISRIATAERISPSIRSS
jgi:hypothetical protein